ncbi:MAG: TlpA family protein disulfide reductase [Prevotella sp.]
MKQLTTKILIFISLLFPLGSNAAQIALSISGDLDGQPAKLYLPDGRELPISIDTSGKGLLTIDVSEPVYAELSYHYASRTLFLTPETNMNIAFESDSFGESAVITGTGSQINTYLNNGRLKAIKINDAGLDEKTFLLKMDSILNANLRELDKAGFPESFNRLETKRLTYFTCAMMPSYPYFHKRIAKDSTYVASADYWNKLEELMAMDASLLQFNEFRTFFTEAANIMVKKQYPDMKYLDGLIQYVESDVTEPLIRELLINKSVYAYIEKNGIDGTDAYREAFHRYVKTPQLVRKFETLCSRWEKLSAGKPSPDFKCTDLSGKSYTLADFKGKYVYIDIWATWCGPCQREIPYLRKLETKYNGKDIYFVSISCDANRQTWEKKVKSGMTGVQLHFDTDDTFMKQYMINGIPRFILLDKEGKIISADMSRPSDPKTAAQLDELLNKRSN